MHRAYRSLRENVTPFQRHSLLHPQRSRSAGLNSQQTCLTVCDEGGTADPWFIENSMRNFGLLPTIMEFKLMTRLSYTFSETNPIEFLVTSRTFRHFIWCKQGPSRLGVDSVPYAAFASALPEVAAPLVDEPVTHHIPQG